MTVEQSIEELADEIIEENDDINPLREDVIEKISMFRSCGLSDSKIKEAVPGMYEIQSELAEKGGLKEPAPEEINIISLPEDYQKKDWT